MNIQLFSKTNMGVATTLLLILLLTQGKFLNFFVDTHLGRSILILFILFISYTNYILGIVSVLFIIIMFTNVDFNYMEGFETSEVITETIDEPMLGKPEPVVIEEQSEELLPGVEFENISNENRALEGFDMVGKERRIQKGVQSNSVPVSDFIKGSDNITPFESSNFAENFSLY